jgi:hypothetical protein
MYNRASAEIRSDDESHITRSEPASKAQAVIVDVPEQGFGTA